MPARAPKPPSSIQATRRRCSLISSEDVELSAIVNTHHHGDHVGCNVGLLARWPVPVFGAAHESIPGRMHALAVEPDNAALIERRTREQAKRDRSEPTVPSAIADERATNPFLRAGEPQVRASVERHAGRPLPDPITVFAEMRAWKNAF